MSTNVVIPSLGLTMEEGIIVEWLKQEGDSVEKDEPIVLIETDKATAEVNSPASGRLGGICAQVGDAIPVGQVIAVIYSDGEMPAAAAANAEPEPNRTPAPAVDPVPEPEKPRTADLEPSEVQARRPAASPAAKKRARELQVDWTLIAGTGPGGRVIEQNVIDYYASLPNTPSPSAAIAAAPLNGMRRTIAKRMTASRQTTASVTIHMQVTMDEAVRLRRQINAKREREHQSKLSYDAIFAKAAAMALRAYPILQAQWDEERLIRPEGIHIGVAVALPEGLLVPVIRDVQSKSLLAVAEETSRLVQAAQRQSLTAQELSGGTFTISNLGKYPVEGFTPVIQLPEASILGIGAILPKAVVIDQQITIAQVTTLSLTFDHRVTDGVPAAAFLTQIKSLLEQPYQLFMD